MAWSPKPILPMLLKKSHPIGPLPDGTNSCHGTGQTITNGTVKPHNTRPTAHAYLSAPQIEAAAASVPGIGGVARLIEAGRFGSSLDLANELIEMLKATQ